MSPQPQRNRSDTDNRDWRQTHWSADDAAEGDGPMGSSIWIMLEDHSSNNILGCLD